MQLPPLLWTVSHASWRLEPNNISNFNLSLLATHALRQKLYFSLTTGNNSHCNLQDSFLLTICSFKFQLFKSCILFYFDEVLLFKFYNFAMFIVSYVQYFAGFRIILNYDESSCVFDTFVENTWNWISCINCWRSWDCFCAKYARKIFAATWTCFVDL